MRKHRQLPIQIHHLLTFYPTGQFTIDLHTAGRKNEKLHLWHPFFKSFPAIAKDLTWSHFRSATRTPPLPEIRRSEAKFEINPSVHDQGAVTLFGLPLF